VEEQNHRNQRARLEQEGKTRKRKRGKLGFIKSLR
ncbi:hypothetical protein A2U01_0092199, partial [Trifolium medium]|nr:hypothetical protein [Trifolium medium]